jgi:hypothetical protein
MVHSFLLRSEAPPTKLINHPITDSEIQQQQQQNVSCIFVGPFALRAMHVQVLCFVEVVAFTNWVEFILHHVDVASMSSMIGPSS